MAKNEMLSALHIRYGYQFSFLREAAGVPAGWASIFARACEDIDDVLGEDKRQFAWTQLKAKWGWARFYYSIDGSSSFRVSAVTESGIVEYNAGAEPADTVAEKVQEIVASAERMTMTMCMMCGAPAELDSLDGYVFCLCEAHRPKARKR